MAKNKKMQEEFENTDEEMTVEMFFDGTSVICAIASIFTVGERDYIALLPLDEDGKNEDGEVWLYRYSENPDDPNEEPVLDNITDEEEYEAVYDAYDEYIDSREYDELVEMGLVDDDMPELD